jgi:hypothetical protein
MPRGKKQVTMSAMDDSHSFLPPFTPLSPPPQFTTQQLHQRFSQQFTQQPGYGSGPGSRAFANSSAQQQQQQPVPPPLQRPKTAGRKLSADSGRSSKMLIPRLHSGSTSTTKNCPEAAPTTTVDSKNRVSHACEPCRQRKTKVSILLLLFCCFTCYYFRMPSIPFVLSFKLNEFKRKKKHFIY